MIQKYRDYIAEDIEDRKQRRQHRGYTYSMVFIIIVSLYLLFFVGLFCDGLSDRLSDNQYVIYVIALLGIMPTAILISVLRALYKDDKSSNDTPGTGVLPTSHISDFISQTIRKID